MAKSYEVLAMLMPNGGYIQTGETYQGIEFIECEPITEAEYQAGFAKYDAWKAKQDQTNAQAKADLLNRLGITADEARLLLS